MVVIMLTPIRRSPVMCDAYSPLFQFQSESRSI